MGFFYGGTIDEKSTVPKKISIKAIISLSCRSGQSLSVSWYQNRTTGFALDYSGLKVDAFDEDGKPKYQRGVSSEPGIYFLGLP